MSENRPQGMSNHPRYFHYLKRTGCAYNPDFDKLFTKHLEDLRMSVNDRCFCGSGKKQKNCHAGVHEKSIIAKIWLKYRAIDAAIQDQRQAQHVTPICAAGCADCCNTYFYISMTEYFMLKNYVLTTQPELLPLIVQKGQNAMEQLRQKDDAEYGRLHSRTSDKDVMTDDKLTDFTCVCPFLLDDHACSAYAARPIICRQYGISESYGQCSKIAAAKLDGNVSVGIVGDIKTEQTDIYLDSFPLPSGDTVWTRPYPLIFWLSRDEKYEEHYQKAIGLPVHAFMHDFIGSMLR